MSQSDTDATTDGSTNTNSNPVADLRDQVTATRERLDALDQSDVSDVGDVDMVELRTEIKLLEDAVESTRKEVVDSELESRIPVGESLLGLSHIESHTKYLAEDPGAVIARMVGQGIDYTRFVSVNESALASEHPGLAEIGRSEYTYLR